MEGLYPRFLEIGYGPESFWEYSIAEIMDLIRAFQIRERRRAEEKKADLKTLLTALYMQAVQIRDAAGFSEEKRLHPLHEYYPSLFEEEGRQTDTDRQLQARNRRMKEFARKHNARLTGGDL